MDYNDLEHKTIFDFTRNKKLLKKILIKETYLDYIENPEKTVEESKKWPEDANVRYIVDFARITNNSELYKELKRQFRDKYPIYFWEPGELWPN
ncbi:MAG: hypothetical protein LBE13_09990 [Bacteroidales bacterium]|jgi:tRNA U34 5-carboxymethylaminomethyl modifying enzyme MnmG/GidA|nr:hypothetical protein [Bacteroidales bacterium]